MCGLFLIPKPQDKPIYQRSSNIFAYPVKNKIQNLSKLLLLHWDARKTGNLGKWRFLFFLHPSCHRKWHERFAQLALPCWPQPQQRKTTRAMRPVRFFTSSLLTVPKNSQPIPQKTWLQDFAAWAISALLTQSASLYLWNKDHCHAHVVKWAGTNLLQYCKPSE